MGVSVACSWVLGHVTWACGRWEGAGGGRGLLFPSPTRGNGDLAGLVDLCGGSPGTCGSQLLSEGGCSLRPHGKNQKLYVDVASSADLPRGCLLCGDSQPPCLPAAAGTPHAPPGSPGLVRLLACDLERPGQRKQQNWPDRAALHFGVPEIWDKERGQKPELRAAWLQRHWAGRWLLCARLQPGLGSGRTSFLTQGHTSPSRPLGFVGGGVQPTPTPSAKPCSSPLSPQRETFWGTWASFFLSSLPSSLDSLIPSSVHLSRSVHWTPLHTGACGSLGGREAESESLTPPATSAGPWSQLCETQPCNRDFVHFPV
ncbi:uncharacterized protein [Desmodus rotundus]|uniref:uncharacterized protein isoform X2 n=1 Tax=Desmodus rotundus TaxID=9430 RepID=UPI002380F902|nr:uncharacterized protein LOC123480201 isoform X2 [Desmodus rotundus]